MKKQSPEMTVNLSSLPSQRGLPERLQNLRDEFNLNILMMDLKIKEMSLLVKILQSFIIENVDTKLSRLQIKKYLSQTSGPLLDRIDIHVEVPALKYREISSKQTGEKSELIRKRVNNAREIQQLRFSKEKIYCNAKTTTNLLNKYCKIDSGSEKIMELAINKMGLSARAYDRILKVSRTIADLAGEENIQQEHVSEAIQYRSLDRENWY